jgi:hypothetical protein
MRVPTAALEVLLRGRKRRLRLRVKERDSPESTGELQCRPIHAAVFSPVATTEEQCKYDNRQRQSKEPSSDAITDFSEASAKRIFPHENASRKRFLIRADFKQTPDQTLPQKLVSLSCQARFYDGSLILTQVGQDNALTQELHGGRMERVRKSPR